jgi:hypothetical protein
MRLCKLAILLAIVATLCQFASAASARTSHACGQIDISYPMGGGTGAIKIRALNISCASARKVVRSCMTGHLKHGWRKRLVADRSAYHEHVLLSSGSRRIVYHVAGGGGCEGG